MNEGVVPYYVLLVVLYPYGACTAPASRHRDPRLTAQPPSAFSGRARGSLA